MDDLGNSEWGEKLLAYVVEVRLSLEIEGRTQGRRRHEQRVVLQFQVIQAGWSKGVIEKSTHLLFVDMASNIFHSQFKCTTYLIYSTTLLFILQTRKLSFNKVKYTTKFIFWS